MMSLSSSGAPLFLLYSAQYVALLFDSDHNRISWRVACELYAKPFMEMACPAET